MRRRYSPEHTPDVARRFEGRLLACSCGFRCLQDDDIRRHCEHPERDVMAPLPMPPLKLLVAKPWRLCVGLATHHAPGGYVYQRPCHQHVATGLYCHWHRPKQVAA